MTLETRQITVMIAVDPDAFFPGYMCAWSDEHGQDQTWRTGTGVADLLAKVGEEVERVEAALARQTFQEFKDLGRDEESPEEPESLADALRRLPRPTSENPFVNTAYDEVMKECLADADAADDEGIVPDYYGGRDDPYEVLKVIGQYGWLEGFCFGNALKYMRRWRQKEGRRDLKKIREYIDFFIAWEHMTPEERLVMHREAEGARSGGVFDPAREVRDAAEKAELDYKLRRSRAVERALQSAPMGSSGTVCLRVLERLDMAGRLNECEVCGVEKGYPCPINPSRVPADEATGEEDDELDPE